MKTIIGKVNIKIGKGVTEQVVVEQCLNLSTSGYDSTFILSLFALVNRWHFSKTLYYNKLIEGVKNVPA
jgi:hypothetical protein